MTDRTLSMRWAAQHLRLRLQPVHLALQAALVRCAHRREARQVPTLRLAALDQMLHSGRTTGALFALSDDEHAEERRIRDRARADGVTLPIDSLTSELSLSAFEVQVLLLCAAVEIDGDYSSIIATLHEDPARRRVTIDLAISLTARSLVERIDQRATLSRIGRLRRYGLLQASESPIELESELSLTQDALSHISGTGAFAFGDPLVIDDIDGTADVAVDGLVERVRRDRIMTVGVWGGTSMERLRATLAFARQLGIELRRPWESGTMPPDVPRALASAVADARALDAALLIDLDAAWASDEVVDGVDARSDTRIILSGREPLRPIRLVARGFAEITLTAPSFEMRRAMWREAVPALSEQQADVLAGRYRLDRSAMKAASALAISAEAIGPAASAIAQPRSLRFADVVTPRRTFDDLVLPPTEERQVRDIAETYLAWPRVADRWGFSTTSSVGVKALFTGEPGTGKTLAAETVAGQLGLSLVRIDLARIVSKWVGETEKNLDAAFAEAADAGALLFFDEAEALFGKRGEVQHGTDRYANLEVSFLLQRLERHDGLVILASNLRDEIDPAFVRRFQHVVHFPRPAERERRRLWRLAFPKDAPLAADVDLSVIARLDMTGAAIVTSARVAALNAARVGASTIGVPDIVEAVTGQFQREARALTATDLGPYGHVLRPLRAS